MGRFGVFPEKIFEKKTWQQRWLSSWLVAQEVRGSINGLATTISEIGSLLLTSRDMAEMSLKAIWFKQYLFMINIQV